MPLANASSPEFALICAAVVLFAALVTVLLVRRRRNAWKHFAKTRGLRYEETADGIRVFGAVAGREFRLATVRESSDTGALGVEEFRMSLTLFGSIPPGIEITQGGALLGQAQKAMENHVVETGDERFDCVAVVKAPDRDAAIRYLNENRQGAIVRLFSIDEACSAGLLNGEIYIEQRELISREQELESHLHLLLEVARRLDDV